MKAAFAFAALHSYPLGAVEIDAFTSEAPGPSSRPEFWSMEDGRFHVDGERVFLKNGKLLRGFGDPSNADRIIADIDVMIDELGYNNVSFNIYADQFDRIGDGRVDSDRREALDAFKRILDHCWARGIFYSLSFETYNVGGGGVPGALFEIYPDIVARNALLEEARDFEYGGPKGRLIPSIYHPRYLKWSRDFIRNFLRDIGQARASRTLYVETTVEPQYLGRNEVDDDQRRAALDFSEAARKAFDDWRLSFSPGDPRRSDFSWPVNQEEREESIGNPIFNEFRGQALGEWVTGDIEAIRSIVPDVYVAVDYNGRFDDPDRLRLGDHDVFLTAIEGADIIQIAPHWDQVWTSASWDEVVHVNDREGKNWAISEHMTANGGFPTDDSVMTSILENTLARGTRWGWDFVNVANNYPDNAFALYYADWTNSILNIIKGDNWSIWLDKIGAEPFEPYPRSEPAHYFIWRGRHFSEEEQELKEISGPGADPGGYGLSNLFRYALGAPPKGPVHDALPAMELAQGTDGGAWVAFTYTRNRMARDVTLSVRVSENLEQWDPVPPGSTTERVIEGESEHIRVQLPEGVSRQFIRLEAELKE